MPSDTRLRWTLIAIIVLSSALNYLDRLVLAALAPTIRSEFGLNAQGYGYVLSAFSIVYAFSSPLMGLVIDRAGLLRGTALVVGLWSFAGTLTALVASLPALLACRAFLGLGEAGGVPATGKAFATYLEPKDRAIGTALNQVGLTLGSSAAPLLAAWAVGSGNWRLAFVVAGVLGFVWIPLWWTFARRVRPLPVEAARPQASAADIVRDRRFLLLVLANILCMMVYSLWTNWTTLFLVDRYGLSAETVNRSYAWVPPIFATLGGLFGGWLARRMMRGGGEIRLVRLRASLIGAVLVLASASAPVLPNAGLATAAISLALFAVTSMSVNYYAVPLDMFGPAHAAFAVSALTGSFGLMQAFLMPLIGASSDRFGWEAACFALAVTPLLSAGVLQLALRPR